MMKITRVQVAAAPTPMAGLALGIASLGWCWENAFPLQGVAQLSSAMLASVLLLILLTKFVMHPHLLLADLKHPVVGSVVPTFAMATMVVSKALGMHMPLLGQGLWLAAVALHVIFLLMFLWHRLRVFEVQHLLPSWFVPPVGIIVAAVATPGGDWLPLSHALLWMGLCSYAVMLPVMLYRLIFCGEVVDASKPTIAILAAPASLSLAGYLTLTAEPSLLLVALLFGIAVLMTALIYLAFFRLLRLPFSPGYAAFTFPLVISATAQYKVAALLHQWPFSQDYVAQIRLLASGELLMATLAVGYVMLRYALHYLLPARPLVTA
ncbi:C4-dicarboxylate ABC transporter [Pokkaliibacter plantistimulans]|uniref:C4-dicarboxylate ABC transporter n=1 Tax=Proteobacteria bacterium 228 TaxID=2083153 RepID=A0A2S5KRA8_9PROT|nr:TDT family transporter [Pokkaliibacter plantistimulans]PPC76796.1 C4-dicarboxylate ABC transporter [Pokkaliibacter plantistimulans]